MEKVTLLLVVFAASSVFAQHQHHDQEHDHSVHRVNVSVYYESLCPDSKKFFTQQLYPSLQGNLSEFVNLTLVPYGKSKATFEVTDWKFECHHGEAECYGNRIQACALKRIDKGQDSPGLGYNKVAVGFINCLMDKADKTAEAVFPTRDCALVNPVSNLLDIENCSNHTDAFNYMAVFGRLTDQIQKPLKSVPTIVFNDQYKQEDNDLAQTNFAKALCQYIESDKPAECSGVSVTVTSGLFALLLALKMF
ncbi:unnamed protein product [Phyllotreta striolata]|uniref:Gamma-interferon-inducible lysosomal thiol reductase n=1 Tax=Phyllotreta striolata TaxID=444603 RepID=A0A9N9TJ45_PHYSR|nr:unnamed protein product [Phyllotreta striolata]